MLILDKLNERLKRGRIVVRRIRKTSWKNLSFIRNCTFGPLNEPAATIKPNEIIEVETWDASGNTKSRSQVRKDALQKNTRNYENPITGPIYVEGARPRDALKIEITHIELPSIGWTSARTVFAELRDWSQQPPSPTKFLEIHDGNIVYTLNDGRIVEIPAKPFIGTIGVSPAFEAISTIVPGRHGGNMDASDICVGNTLYLPVAVKGALLGLGDVHAVQGDGEICGTAVEVSAKVTLQVGIEKNKELDWPRIESKNEIMTVCSAKPLEDAARLAFLELIKWLENDYYVERSDAYMLLSLAAKARIAQIVDPLFTVVAKLPKKMLPEQRA